MSKEWTFDMILHPVLPQDRLEVGNGTYGGMVDVLNLVTQLSDAELGKLMRDKVFHSIDLSWDERRSFRRYLENNDPALLSTITEAQQEIKTVTLPSDTYQSMEHLLADARQQAQDANAQRTTGSVPQHEERGRG